MKRNEKSGNKSQEKEADDIGSLSNDYKKEYIPEQKKNPDKTPDQEEVNTNFPGFKLDKDGEVKKLNVGEHVQGLLIDKEYSDKYSAGIYKIKSKDNDVPIVILGSTVLDKKMKLHNTGEILIIQRAADSLNQKSQVVHNWNVYSKLN